MSFLEILQELANGVRGGVAATIMGTDGLSIQQYARPDSGRSGCDVESVAIEYGKVIDEIKKASGLLNLGIVEEVLISTAGKDVLLRIVSDEYYIAFVLGENSNVGKARYFLRKAAEKTKKEILK